MKKIQFYCSLLACCLLLACGSQKGETETTEEVAEEEVQIDGKDGSKTIGDIKLTDGLMKNYITIIPKLKEKGASLSPDMGKIEGLYQYNQLEGMIKDGGFKDLNEFIMVHTKIAYSFAANEMKAQNIEQKIGDAQAEGIKKIEESLKDPNITAEQKQVLEMTLEQLKGSGQGANAVQDMMDAYKGMITEEDKALVEKYSADLKKLYEQN
jgi:hypothetical protein